MKLLDRSTLLGALGIVVLGIAFGVASNLTAGASRRLEWTRDYPDPIPGKKNCPETLPEPGSEPVTLPAATLPEATAPAEPPPVEPVPSLLSPEPSAASALEASAPAPVPVASTAAAVPTLSEVAPPMDSIPPLPPGEPFVELSPQQVDVLYDQRALFVDARVTSQYEDGHVAGALPIAIWEAGVAEKIAATVFEVEGDKSRPIVIYCNGGDCEDSHNLARMFYEDGYTALYVYKDGYPDWLSRARPIRTGSAR